MIITESQLRLIVRQELLEVLRQNDEEILDEGLRDAFNILRKNIARGFKDLAFPLGIAAGLGGSLGTAAVNTPGAIDGPPVDQQIMAAVGAFEAISTENAKKLEENIQIDHENKTATSHGLVYNGVTKQLTYENKSVKVSDNLLKMAQQYLSKSDSRSGKYSSSDASTFLHSENVQQELILLISENPNLFKAAKAQQLMNMSLMSATMFLIFFLMISVLGADEKVSFYKQEQPTPTNRGRRQ